METVQVCAWNERDANRPCSPMYNRFLPESTRLHAYGDEDYPAGQRELYWSVSGMKSYVDCDFQTEEFMLGQYLRERYLNASSPNFIPTINNSIVDLNQVLGTF